MLKSSEETFLSPNAADVNSTWKCKLRICSSDIRSGASPSSIVSKHVSDGGLVLNLFLHFSLHRVVWLLAKSKRASAGRNSQHMPLCDAASTNLFMAFREPIALVQPRSKIAHVGLLARSTVSHLLVDPCDQVERADSAGSGVWSRTNHAELLGYSQFDYVHESVVHPLA